MQNADVLDYIGEPNFKICLLQLAFQSVEIAKKKSHSFFRLLKKGMNLKGTILFLLFGLLQ